MDEDILLSKCEACRVMAFYPFLLERLRDYFSKYGEVLDCVVMRDAATGKSRGFAFLTFADPNVVDEVASRHHHLDGKNVR